MSISLEQAQEQAQAVMDWMKPGCKRIEVVGSVRREKAEVKDIELLCIPTWTKRPMEDARTLFNDEPDDAFGQLQNDLHCVALAAQEMGLVRWIKPGTSDIVDWPIQPDGKYWRGLLPSGVKLDVFLCGHKNWGIIQVIRTGSRDFSAKVVTRLKYLKTPCVGGYVTIKGERVPTPEESDVFTLLDWPYVPPQNRT
jgi:DNA polymerase/3'-5' exonuclease PolX